jgi:hypothetical protein
LNFFGIGLGDDALLGQHIGMCLRAADVLRRHRLVEADGGIDGDHQVVI